MKGLTIDSLKKSYLRGRTVLAIDLVLSFSASMLVLLAIDILLGREYMDTYLSLLCLVVGVVASGLMFLFTRTYCIIIRHLSVRDCVPFALSAAGKAIAILLGALCIGPFSSLVPFMVLMDFFLTLFLLIGVRVVMILVYESLNLRLKSHSEVERILIYGTSVKSVAVVPRLFNSSHYKIVGFIHRASHGDGLVLERMPVYCFDDDKSLEAIVLNNSIDAVLFARDIDAQAEEDGLIKYCSEHHIKTLIVPNLDEVTEGQPLLRPREVKVEDLLGRQEIVISMGEIKANFAGKVVMVTGAAGSIGSELVRQLAGFGVKKLVLYDNAETPMHNLRLELEDKYKGLDFVPIIGDVRQPARLDFAFRTWHPQVVFHAAAYKHVPLMEENPCEAVLVNVYGSRNVADKCIEYGVEKMVMISTDKAVNPTNIMGCTKRLAEIYVQSLGLAVENGQIKGSTKFVTTRFGNVLGSNGSVIPRFREQIAKGGPVTVTHPDINRFFMTIPEACRLVMEAATMSTGNQIFVFDMGKPVKIDQLARRMITLAGFTPDKDIKIEYTGLRPGEKLYEEVLSNEENTLPAFHERIRIAKVREYGYTDAAATVDTLEDLARKVEIPDMVRLMKKTVPEYKSENSRFKDLD